MRLNEELDALSLRCVDRIVLVNQGMLEKPRIKSLPQKKVSIVNNGIELVGVDGFSLDRVSGETSIEVIREFCENKLVVASIGRLSYEKGFSCLVEAVAKVRQELGEDVRLLLVGDGRLREELQQQAENCGLKGSFLITGYMKMLADLLGLVDVYAISSLTEGLPITLLEAMDSGTPIVATAVGGIPFVVQDKQEALLVPSMDAQALGDALGTIIRDGSLAAGLVVKASEKVSKEFSSGHMAKQYQSVYENLLSGS